MDHREVTGAAARRTGERTIAAFGEQWNHYTQNDGYYGSVALFADIIAPLLTPADFEGARVAEIGSGTGRVVAMLLAAGAAHVTAVEPSSAFTVLSRNTAAVRDRVSLLNVTGDRLPAGLAVDYVVSIGVVHHMPDPRSALVAAFAALKPGGRIVIWVYAIEGNERYLAWSAPVRAITTRSPHLAVSAISHALALLTSGYLGVKSLTRSVNDGYLDHVYARLPYRDRHLVVYDQLRPRHTKHYTARDLEYLLTSCGYTDVRLFHRHGYSWTAVAVKPAERRNER